MTRDDVIFFKKWFTDYCRSFYSSNSEDQRNIQLKEEHTFNVCENIIEIGKELSLGEKEMMLAETIAIFHDIGRFPQYAEYRTFLDSASVNHGLLGAQTLIEEKTLGNLPEDEQELILQSVRFHNVFSMPKIKRKDILFFLKLIRDADKLDVWRVCLEFYELPEGERASAVGHGFLDTDDYSEDVLSSIFKEKMASLARVKTLNDFKIMQLSWVYDLNFKPSFRMLSERGYIERITLKLPKSEEIDRASAYVKDYVHMKLKG